MKHHVQAKIKAAYDSYIQNRLGLSEGRDDKLLANLRLDKAAGLDEIRSIVLKELRSEIAPIIQLIFERSLATGEVPFNWTKANVCQIFKMGDKSDPANYRPISMYYAKWWRI